MLESDSTLLDDTSSKATSYNGNMRRHPSKRADIQTPQQRWLPVSVTSRITTGTEGMQLLGSLADIKQVFRYRGISARLLLGFYRPFLII